MQNMRNSVDSKHVYNYTKLNMMHFQRAESTSANNAQCTFSHICFALRGKNTKNDMKRKSSSSYLSFSFLSACSDQLSPSALLYSEYIGQMLECLPEFIDHYLICVVFIIHSKLTTTIKHSD